MAARLDALGESLAGTRSEAIAGRSSVGIERVWLEDEEFYEGIDELNRGEDADINWRTKPPGQAVAKRGRKTRSTVFPNITGPFTDAAAARIADMLLPTDDRPWTIKPTPDPELMGLAAQYEKPRPRTLREGVSEGIRGWFAKPRDDYQETAPMMSPEEAKEVLEQATETAKRAEKRIEDWHVECQWHAQVRTVIEDAARIGVGILKGPVPKSTKRIKYRAPVTDIKTGEETLGGIDVEVDENPISKHIDPWNFYPDPGCGEDIQNGSYVWERDYLTKKQVRDLLLEKGYVKEQIMAVLEEGPIKAGPTYEKTTPQAKEVSQEAAKTRSQKFEVWYMHGIAEKDDLEAAGADLEGLEDPHIACVITMINNRVIRAAQRVLDHGGYPYDVMVWRRRSGHWSGTGVARMIRVAQKIVVGATRNLMDNAGIAAGPMIIFKHGTVVPSDGVASIAPRKVWYIKYNDDTIDDARKAIGTVTVDMLVDDLLKIVQHGMELAQDTTGLPMLLQGQMGAAPNTVGGMTLLNNNASAVLRRLARLFDDRITEPHLRRYYVWILQYGNENEKGDFQIDAIGSSALVERDIQNQELAQMQGIVLDPRYGLDPEKWVDEYLKSRHFDPKRLKFDDDVKREMMSRWQELLASQEAMSDPRIRVAEINAQARLESESMRGESSGAETLAKLRHEGEQNEIDRQIKLLEGGLMERVTKLNLAGSATENRETIKAALAKEVMKLRTTRDLAGVKAREALMPTPAVEPPGKAKPGESWQS